MDRTTLLGWEKELLGAYISGHPLIDILKSARERDERFHQISEIDTDLVGQSVRLLGMVIRIRKMTTRSNRTMAVIEFDHVLAEFSLKPQEIIDFPPAPQEGLEAKLIRVVDPPAILHSKARAFSQTDHFLKKGSAQVHVGSWF